MNSLLPSLLLSSTAVVLLVLGENPGLEAKKIAGRTKDRSLVKGRMYELNRGSANYFCTDFTDASITRCHYISEHKYRGGYLPL